MLSRQLVSQGRRSMRIASIAAGMRHGKTTASSRVHVDAINGAHPCFVPGPLLDIFPPPGTPTAEVSLSSSKKKSLSELKVGFIGWGNMAQAISFGLLNDGVTAPHGVMVSGRRDEVLRRAEEKGMGASKCNSEVAEWADVIIVAVKPQVVGKVMPEIASVWNKDKLLISVCAGVTIDSFLEALGKDARVVRTMPNTPSMIGEGATAYAGSTQCTEQDLELVSGMLAAVSNATHHVPEHLLDAVTGVSGSGPAYVYMMIQALSDAGVHSGLPRDVSLSLATQTLIGAAKLVQSSGTHPAVLKEAVTSPGGTTIAGVRALEQTGFNAAVMAAVDAAKTRSQELSKTASSAPRQRARRGGSKVRKASRPC